MSLTYSEIYTTSLRAQSKILNGEKTHSSSKSKYVSLIKKFSNKQKSRKNKQRKLNSKSVQISNKTYNKKPKNKTKSKQKLENPRKQKLLKIKKNINNNINNYINNEINNQSKQPNFNSNDIKEFNSNFSERNNCNNNHNGMINKYMLGQKIICDNNKNNSMYNTLQNSTYNIYNFSKMNKTYNNDYIENYINIFKLRQSTANFRDKIKNKNNTFNVNISNDLLSSYNSDINNNYLKTHSYSKYNTKISKTILKANKLREEIEKMTGVGSNKNISNYRPYSSFYKHNYIYPNNEKDEINNNKENININNDNNFENGKNDYTYNNDNNDLNSLTHHFFDRTMRVPKRIIKYFNSPKNNMNNNTIKSNTNNNYNQKEMSGDNKNNNKKNIFRKQTNLPQNKVKLVKQNMNNNILNNNLNNNFNSDICRAKYHKLDYITHENVKLNNLLKKIPSSRGFRNKSYDLMEYIMKLKKFNNKMNLINSININNNIDSVYPVNECEAFKKIKNNFFD